MTLHPLVQASIEQWDEHNVRFGVPCGVKDVCSYHNGMQFALDAVAPDLAIAQRAKALAADADRLLNNPISKRMADGWYPSGHDHDGNVQHDRHVMVWVRHYESLLSQLSTTARAAVLGDDQ